LETHGKPLEIKWGEFKLGTSFFVPGVDQVKLVKDMRSETARLRIPVIIRKVVERNVLGIRVWRTL
jgi:hypothetical protein